MKAKKAKVNKIFSATACLVVSLGLAIFSCFAWFTNNKTVDSGLNANIDGDFITNFTYTTYALTGKTESGDTTTYTVGDAYGSDEDGYFAIASYGSASAEATLLVLTYNVKDGKSTKLTFNGNSAAPSIVINHDGEDSEGNQYDYVQTYLSNAISMRLANAETTTTTDGDGNDVTTIDSVSSGNIERCFMDPTADNIKQEAIFNGVEADQTDYSVALYILIEYDDDNVTALYGMNDDAYLSMPIGFTNDLALTIEAADEEHTHTYSKWTVTEYTEETGIALLSDGGEEDDPYLYTATRTCTGCSSSTDGHTQTVNIKQSEIITNSSTKTAAVTVTVDGEKCTITFSVAAAGSSSDEEAITTSTTIDLTSYGGDEISGTTCEWNGITIDTTAEGASFVPESDGYVKVTAGTVITINVASTATVTVSYYTGYSEGCTVTVENGVATITCTEDTCITAINVEVPASVSAVSVTGGDTAIYMDKDKSLTLTASVSMSDDSTYNGDITWSSSNESVATVSDSGVVTGNGAGTVTITATATLNGVSTSGTYTITVTCENHTESEAVTENEVEATCTTDGSYDTVVYCSVCGEEISRTTTTTVATDHSYSENDWTYNSTTHWNVCDNCGEKLNETSHTFENGYCTVCGASENSTIVAIFTSDDTSLASSAGFTVSSGSYKSGVSFTYNETEYNAPLKLESSTSVTFTTTEEMTMTIGIYTAGGNLNVDGTTYTDDDSDGTYTSETTEATCTEDGSTVYTATATYDGVTYTDTYTVTISATGEHTYSTEWSYDSSTHWQVCSVCGTTTEAEAHTFENGTCTVCGATETTATGTDHTSTFSISELVTAIETRTGTDIADKTQLASTDFTGSNAFLTLLEEQSANQYRTNNDGVIEIKGEGLSVTFLGTGTITISFASTGSTNVSSLALIDEDGNYVTGVMSETTATTETVSTENGYYYNVTGSSTYVTVTFTVSTAGTYIIATNLDTEQNRGARISSIVMVDTYVDTTNE